MNIPKFIKSSRKAMGLTQHQFGLLISKNRLSVSSYETGRAIPPGDVIFKVLELRFPKLISLSQKPLKCNHPLHSD